MITCHTPAGKYDANHLVVLSLRLKTPLRLSGHETTGRKKVKGYRRKIHPATAGGGRDTGRRRSDGGFPPGACARRPANETTNCLPLELGNVCL
jgi:hypothetical protein